MKKTLKLISLIIGFILIIFCISGCQKKTSEIEHPYRLFYINADGTSIVAIGYTAVNDSKETLKLVDEFIDKLSNPIANDQAAVPPISANLKLKKLLVDKKAITIDFDKEYLNLEKYNELLIRAAIVRSLGQIDGIESVFFTVNDAPITDASGNAIGAMTMDSFATIQNDSNLDKRKQEVTLYFSDLSGDNLIIEKRRITYTSSVHMGKAIMSELMAGSQSSKGIDVIPRGTELLGLYVEAGVCYVNFNKQFSKGMAGVEPMTTIYAITNSLAELTNVNKVHITIENDPKIKYMDTISLDQSFARNLDIVEKE